MLVGDVFDFYLVEVFHFFFYQGQVFDKGVIFHLVVTVDLGSDELGVSINFYLPRTKVFGQT